MTHVARVLMLMVTLTLVAAACGSDADGANASEGFVGLPIDDAVARAEQQQRPWRIGREDDDFFVLTDDIVVGRVTFDIDDGLVTAARIETGAGGPTLPPDSIPPSDQDRAELEAKAVERLVTVDNSFEGGSNPFQRIDVAAVIGGDPARPLQPLALELIAAALETTAQITFIPDADTVISELFDQNSTGTAVVSIDDLRIEGPHAEIEMRMWCGSLCGVFLTYEAELTDAGWEILGTTGPITVS